jgi:hypothetical protein
MQKQVRPRETDHVSEALRQLWESAERDPVPAEFLDLLDQLDGARAPIPQRSAKGSAGGADGAS